MAPVSGGLSALMIDHLANVKKIEVSTNWTR